jgi:IS5 family transposase
MPRRQPSGLVAFHTKRHGAPPIAVLTTLCIPFMRQWFTLSDPAMGEVLHGMPLLREFAGLALGQRLPDEPTILRFRHLLDKHKLADQILATVNDLLQRKGLMLKAGTVVNATLIAEPSSRLLARHGAVDVVMRKPGDGVAHPPITLVRQRRQAGLGLPDEAHGARSQGVSGSLVCSMRVPAVREV